MQQRVEGKLRWIELDEPLSASSVNNRLRELRNLWTVLDGRHAPNPVREVQEADEPDPEPRGLSYAVIQAILDAMPDRGRGIKGQSRDGTRSRPICCKAVMTSEPSRSSSVMRTWRRR